MQRVDERLHAAVQSVEQRCGLRPAVGIILGSGLGGLAHEIAHPVCFPYTEIPGMVRSTAFGHRGQLLLGSLADAAVVVMDGRIHRYEGYGDAEVAFPVRLLAALGAERLIVTNAAGGLNPHLRVGDIVVISDHIDMAKTRSSLWEAPQVGGSSLDAAALARGGALGTRAPYDRALREVALKAARAGDFIALPGVYLATLGPTYETRAEYRMMRFLGADVVGMSTAPEVQTATALGMRVLGLSVVSNVAQPDSPQSTDHQEVLAAGRAAASRVSQIITAVLRSGA
jgi:purine-nucleoside phosphorylase